jgi:hypothetical protein
MRSVGALRFPVGPSIAAARVSSSGGAVMSKVTTFLPLATTTVDAERANSRAASRPLRILVASTISPTDQP